MITRNFNLYLNAGHSVPLVINVNQYDSGEQWVFTLYNADGTQYTPSTGAIVGIKSDGLGIINSGSVVDGKVVINETEQMTAAVGKAVFELLIDSQTHGTANFIVLVEEKPGNNADLSESDLSLLQEAIDATSPLPTGGSVGQVLTKTANGSTWSNAGTPTQEQVADAVSDWADEHITVETGVVIDTSLAVAGAAADSKKVGDEITDLKSAVKDITGNSAIPYNYPNSFFYTQGATWNPNAPSASTDWDAAVVDCSLGDVFTVSGIGGASPKIWAFADAENNILLRKEASTVAITEELIIAPTNATKLILNNKKSVYPNAVSYRGKLIKTQVSENTVAIASKLGNAKTVVESLPANSTVGQFWNLYFDVSPSDGDIALVRVNEYTGVKLSNIRVNTIDANNVGTVVYADLKIGRTVPVYLSSGVKTVWVQLRRTESENNVETKVDFICSDSGGVAETIAKNFKPVFYVEKDGSGDFDKLVDAVNCATQFMDSTVYVGAGTWNVISEFGKTYMESVGSTQRGLYLKNRIHLIFSSNAVVTAMYDGFDGYIDDDTVEWFAIFNSGEYGFTLENMTSISRNIRYPIHDERSQTSEEAYKNHYINCNITHSNQKYDPAQTKHGYAQCIGGGLGKDGHIIIEGCVFENTYQYSADAQGRKNLVTYHVNNKPNATGRSIVEIKGCYFKGEGTARAGYYGTNTDVSTMLVHDNSMGKEPYVAAESAQSTTENIQMLAWNNEIRS